MYRYAQLLAVAAVVAATPGARDVDKGVVTSLLLPFNDPNSFVATILNVDQSATTFAYTCASNVAPDDCGMETRGTVVQGTSTWQLTLSQSNEEYGLYAMTAACSLTSSKNEASCLVSATQSDTDGQSSTTRSAVSTGYVSDLQAVTIVAGLDLLTDGVPTNTMAPTTGSGAGSSSGPKSTGGSSPSSSSSATSSFASGSHTSTPNAAPAVTQHAALAGVAAVVGALAL